MTRNTSNSPSFLLEIGTEDLPARFLPDATRQLGEAAKKVLMESRIGFSSVRTYSTPRRLAVIAEGLPDMQEDIVKEVFGPSTKAAFNKDGTPSKAAVGFARSQGVSVENLVVKTKEKGEYVVAVIDEKGLPVKEILPRIVPNIVSSIHLPKAMRWGNSTIRFVRPIRGFVSLLGTEVIRFEIEEIKSDNLLQGHRFLSPGPFPLTDAENYRELLAENCVIVDFEERKESIMRKVNEILEPFGERLAHDEELLGTVTNLVEFPMPVLALFPEKYLSLPRELLITVMKGHQKYFAVEDTDGKITNHFVVVSNTGEANAAIVRTGAERVIKARFEDARFYYEEDTKKALSERLEDLRKVTFHEGLGSLYDKMNRVVELTRFIASCVIPGHEETAVRAATLAKTDLISGVVREFPELQGIMGKYYAMHDREDAAVAQALEEQYMPAYSGGRIPSTELGAAVSLADKTDNIAAFFSIGEIPTGSEDPFALRRQALGIIAILRQKGYKITLKDLFGKALPGIIEKERFADTEGKIRRFFEGRLEILFADAGYGSELIQSVLPLSFGNQLNDIVSRMAALSAVRETSEFNDFLIAIKRICNIVPKAQDFELKTELLSEDAEKTLMAAFDSVRVRLQDALSSGKYDDSISLFMSLTPAINNFFDKVLVMDKHEEIRLNRLSLLKNIWDTVSRVADFSKFATS